MGYLILIRIFLTFRLLKERALTDLLFHFLTKKSPQWLSIKIIPNASHKKLNLRFIAPRKNQPAGIQNFIPQDNSFIIENGQFDVIPLQHLAENADEMKLQFKLLRRREAVGEINALYANFIIPKIQSKIKRKLQNAAWRKKVSRNPCNFGENPLNLSWCEITMMENYPTEVAFVNSRLLIAWNDDHKSSYDPFQLRLACPCAQCVSETTGERLIRPADILPDIKPQEMRPVGRYGVSFQWSDGHSTGIYTFARLRELCRCELCVKRA
jgi:ATP-binding protein involved in chromosome partitioning